MRTLLLVTTILAMPIVAMAQTTVIATPPATGTGTIASATGTAPQTTTTTQSSSGTLLNVQIADDAIKLAEAEQSSSSPNTSLIAALLTEATAQLDTAQTNLSGSAPTDMSSNTPTPPVVIPPTTPPAPTPPATNTASNTTPTNTTTNTSPTDTTTVASTCASPSPQNSLTAIPAPTGMASN